MVVTDSFDHLLEPLDQSELDKIVNIQYRLAFLYYQLARVDKHDIIVSVDKIFLYILY